ncbi:TPA: recombinase family protein [Legionella pneumophila]
MNISNKINKEHLQKVALVYVRQSTQAQLVKNTQSLELQYALKDKAKAYGWTTEKTEVIDSDLGISGSAKDNREGFKDILLKVSSGEVGIVFAYDATRLSRNCGDWYSLLDICGYKNTLIGDSDGVYDPSDVNDRLLLGLKGQLAEFELKTIKSRMHAGKMNKVEKGELYLDCPSGYVKSPLGKIEFDPNEEVRSNIKLVFDAFRKQKSIAKILKYFVDNHIELPRKSISGDIVWKEATGSSLLQILKNPTYAGIYAYGKTKIISRGQKIKRRKVNEDDWLVSIRDNHPAYISEEEFYGNQLQIKNNYAEYCSRLSSGVPRSGQALLHGIIYCGKCGHKMYVSYTEKYLYICVHDKRAKGTKSCSSISAKIIDDAVSEAFINAMNSIEIDAYNNAIKENNKNLSQAEELLRKRLERKNYESRLREKQYMSVDPENRLVASKLEENWEKSLKEISSAKKELDHHLKKYSNQLPISEEQKIIFANIGKNLPAIWDDRQVLPLDKKKQLIRALIEKINIKRIKEICTIRIVWKGGLVSEINQPVTVNALKDLSNYDDFIQKFHELYQEGHGDREIASRMTSLGYRSTSSLSVSSQTIKSLRIKMRIYNDKRGEEKNKSIKEEYLTVSDIMNLTGKGRSWVHYHISRNNIEGVKSEQKHNIHLFPKTDSFIEKVKNLGRLNNEQKVGQK